VQLHLAQQLAGFAAAEVDTDLAHHLDDLRPHLPGR
jgi:hypothetical protein